MPTLPELLAGTPPVTVAPMAGGPSGPRLVTAAARAGHVAQLAAGYRTAAELADQVAAVRADGVDVFGVNLFAPNPAPIAAERYRAYAEELRPTAERLGVTALPDLREDDDDWAAKTALLLDDPVPLVSCTFGLPDATLVRRLRSAGTIVLQTVTSVLEARAAADAGVDVLVVQGIAAGGHSGTFDPATLPADVPLTDLVRSVRAATTLPVIAAGGLAHADDVARVLVAGAAAVAVGTAVLRSPESGTSDVHRAALTDPTFDRTALTRAFTGRPARALVTDFVREHPDAPVGYPAVHHLTGPIRAAARAAGDPSAVNLWAGTGWRRAAAAPVADLLAALVPG